MENGNSSSSGGGIGRTKSDQLVELVVGAVNSNNKSSWSPASNESPAGGGNVSRKSSRRASPGKSSSIRKSRSAQLKVEVVDEVSSGAALSRASSASFGLSFSFTGFTLPPDHHDEIIADYNPFADHIPEDIEAGTRKPKFETEPTLPIFLKATMKLDFIAIDATNRNIHTIQWLASNFSWVWSGQVQSCT